MAIVSKFMQTERVCHLSKYADTFNISWTIDDLTFVARQVELLFYGDYRMRILVKLYTNMVSIWN